MDSNEFTRQFKDFWKVALAFSKTAHREGLLVLEDRLEEVDEAQRPVFKIGMRLTVDGTDASYIEKVLTNMVNLETDKDAKVLKTIQKEAVLGIQESVATRYLALLLNSYVDRELWNSEEE